MLKNVKTVQKLKCSDLETKLAKGKCEKMKKINRRHFLWIEGSNKFKKCSQLIFIYGFFKKCMENVCNLKMFMNLICYEFLKNVYAFKNIYNLKMFMD
jgi:hypothetical protein